MERLSIRPSYDAVAQQRMRDSIHGKKLGIWAFTDAAADTDRMLNEMNLAANYEEYLRHKLFVKRIKNSDTYRD